MGRMTCTEPQCLYKGAFYFIFYIILPPFTSVNCKVKIRLKYIFISAGTEQIYLDFIQKQDSFLNSQKFFSYFYKLYSNTRCLLAERNVILFSSIWIYFFYVSENKQLNVAFYLR